jgi:hypothetical protein
MIVVFDPAQFVWPAESNIAFVEIQVSIEIWLESSIK